MIVCYVSAIIFVNCILNIMTPWYYLWVEETLKYSVYFLMLLALAVVLRPDDHTYFFSHLDYQRYLQITETLDRGNENEHYEEPWDINKIIFLIWPNSNESSVSNRYAVGYEEELFLNKINHGDSK